MGKARGSRLLPPAERHLVTRFSYGLTPELAQDVRKAGGGEQWFEQQLTRPGKVPDAAADAVRAWWPDLDRSPSDLWLRQITEVRVGWEVMGVYGLWLLVCR